MDAEERVETAKPCSEKRHEALQILWHVWDKLATREAGQFEILNVVCTKTAITPGIMGIVEASLYSGLNVFTKKGVTQENYILYPT